MSAYVACLGIALAEMVVQIGMKKVDRPGKIVLQKALRLLRKVKKDTFQIVDLDPQVYLDVLKTYTQTKRIPEQEQKNRLIDEALENSFRLQADLALLVTMAKQAVRSLEGAIRGSIANDLNVSRSLLEAAFKGAYDTAQINRVYLKDPEKKKQAARALEEVKKRFERENA